VGEAATPKPSKGKAKANPLPKLEELTEESEVEDAKEVATTRRRR
jgi:hypothetical protein